jgi:hypothetical protein
VAIGTSAEFGRLEAIATDVAKPSEPVLPWDPWRDRDGIGL